MSQLNITLSLGLTISNGYLKVMFKITKKGHLPTPAQKPEFYATKVTGFSRKTACESWFISNISISRNEGGPRYKQTCWYAIVISCTTDHKLSGSQWTNGLNLKIRDTRIYGNLNKANDDKIGGTQSHIAEYQRVLLVRWEPGSHFGFHGIVAFVTIMSPVNHRIVQWIPTWLMCESQWFAIMFATVSPHLGKFNSEFSCLWEILLVSLSPLSVNFSSTWPVWDTLPISAKQSELLRSIFHRKMILIYPPKSLKKKDFGQENLPFPCRETQAKASLRRGAVELRLAISTRFPRQRT